MCYICGANVTSSGVHGLSCRESVSHHVRRSAFNDLVERVGLLVSADRDSISIRTTSLMGTDGKRSDGLTMMPWKCMVCDVTCPDNHTGTESFQPRRHRTRCIVTTFAEVKKRLKYIELSSSPSQLDIFVAIAEESSGLSVQMSWHS